MHRYRNTPDMELSRSALSAAPRRLTLWSPRGVIALAAALLAAAAVTAVPARAYTQHGCVRQSFGNAAGSREYLLCTPEHLSASRMLVVHMPGALQSADQAVDDTMWAEAGELAGFVTLVPEATLEEKGSFDYAGDANQHRGAGIPSIIAGMTQHAVHALRLNPAHVYISGMSNGGAMTSVMAATYPDVFRAVLSHSGAEYACSKGVGGCPETAAYSAQRVLKEMGVRRRAVPFIVFHGLKDPMVPPTESDKLVSAWLKVADVADDGRANGSVKQSPAATRRGQVSGGYAYTVRTYRDRHGCLLGEQWAVEELGHAWSGGHETTVPGADYDTSSPRVVSIAATDTKGPDATAAALRFFTSPLSGPGSVRTC